MKKILFVCPLIFVNMSLFAISVTSTLKGEKIVYLPKVGTIVKKGEPLVKFSESIIDARITAKKAQLASAKACLNERELPQLERVTKLLPSSSVSKDQWDCAKYEFMAAQYAIDERKAELDELQTYKQDFYKILAPYACKVSKVFLLENSGTDFGQQILEVEKVITYNNTNMSYQKSDSIGE